MLIKFTVDQLDAYWPALELAMEKSLPICNEHIKSMLVHDLMCGVAVAWMSVEDAETQIANGFVMTRFSDDYLTGGRTLTIIFAHAPKGVPDKMWAENFFCLKKYAESFDCHILDFYTNNPAIINQANKFDVLNKQTYYQLSF